MGDLFDEFPELDRKLMRRAEEEAARLNHEYVGTEHVLLGLIKSPTGIAGRVFWRLGCRIEDIRKDVETLVPPLPFRRTSGFPLTPRAKRAMGFAQEEAFGNNARVDAGHILIGLLREEEGVGSQILSRRGIKIENVRDALLDISGSQ